MLVLTVPELLIKLDFFVFCLVSLYMEICKIISDFKMQFTRYRKMFIEINLK